MNVAHPRSRCAVDDLGDVGEGSDNGFIAGVAREVACGLDFGAHRARRQVQASQLVRSDLAQAGLIRRTPIGVDAVDVGGDDEEFGVELLEPAAPRRGPCR